MKQTTITRKSKREEPYIYTEPRRYVGDVREVTAIGLVGILSRVAVIGMLIALIALILDRPVAGAVAITGTILTVVAGALVKITRK